MTERASFRFAAVGQNQFAFVFHPNSQPLWDSAYRSTRSVSVHFGRYETLGDGLTPHGPDCAIQAGDLELFAYSLATYWGAHWAEYSDDERRDICYAFPTAPDAATIAFAASIIHDAKKYKYYSWAERKISASSVKQHDRRWEPIPEWCDGSLEATYRLLADHIGGYLLEKILIRQTVFEATKSYMGSPCAGEPLGLAESDREGLAIDRAVRAMVSWVDGFRAMISATCDLENYARNEGRKWESAVDAT